MAYITLKKIINPLTLFFSLFFFTPSLYADTLLQKANTYYEKGFYVKAQTLFEQLAKKGNVDAEYSLGVIYEGGMGVDKNMSQALQWYIKAAKNGHINAQYNVASLYYKGRETKQDYQKARYWYVQAANNGDTQALYNLGVMYLKAEGVIRNKLKAYERWKEAAKIGNPQAEDSLDVLCKESPWVCK